MQNKKYLKKPDGKIEDKEIFSAQFEDIRTTINPWKESLKIILVYISIGTIWIVFSDKILTLLVTDPFSYQKAQTYKGWIYVLLSGLVFYYIVGKKIYLLKEASDLIYKGYKNVGNYNESLKKTQSELEQRVDELEYYQNALRESQLQHALSIEGSNDGLWSWDLKNGVYKTSTLTKAGFGYSEIEQNGINTMEKWRDLVHPKDLDYGVKVMDRFLDGSENAYDDTYENIFRVRSKSGEYRWVQSKGKTVRDSLGRVISFGGSHTDITEQIELKNTLNREKNLVDSISKEAPLAIIVTDKGGLIKKYNNYAEEIFGYTESEVMGKKVMDFLVEESAREVGESYLKDICSGRTVSNMELRTVTKSGSEKTVIFSNSNIYEGEELDSLIFIGVDITERKLMEDRLEFLAFKDGLTGLPNLSRIKEDLKIELPLLDPEKDTMALVYIDIDDFKLVNDTMGHVAGDELIRHFAEDLRKILTKKDSLYRFGGDEYIIALRGFSCDNELHQRLDELMAGVNKQWEHRHQNFMISSSLGIAIYPKHGISYEELMQNADTALSYAKNNGKNRYLIYNDEMKDKTWNHIQLLSDLRSALNYEEFILVYQPQYNLKNGDLIGLEALIRWKSPDRGMVYPLEFIPFAEKTGLIEKIEEWVIATACKKTQQWRNLGHEELLISINISGKTLSKESWQEKADRLLTDCKESTKVIFEITETALIEDLEDSLNALEYICSLGIQIALDDFGTGYSSLTYIQKLPIDIIKLDKSFVWSIGREDEKSFIVKTVIDLAHNLGLKVIAEGIETKEQLDFLIEAGCDLGQGYYLSKPLKTEDIEKLLKSVRNK